MLNETQIQQIFDQAIEIVEYTSFEVEAQKEIESLLKQTLPVEHQEKFEYIWSKAYDECHAYGLIEVVYQAIDLINLVLKFVQ